MKKIIIILFLTLMILPSVSAYDDEDEESPFYGTILENATITGQEPIPDANFTTYGGYTFTYRNAYKITYVTEDGKEDYIIRWQCNDTGYYEVISSLNFYSMTLCDYIDGGVCFIDCYPEIDTVEGIIMDSENITYTKGMLVNDILHRYDLYITGENETAEAIHPNGVSP